MDAEEESEWETEEEEEEEETKLIPLVNEEVVEEGHPVSPGDVLVAAQPFVFAIQPEFRNKVCEKCFIYKDEWKGIQLCPDCAMVGYCGEACRLQDRDRHKIECKIVMKTKTKTWNHRVWFLARACIRVQTEGWDEPDRINNAKSRTFRDLLDHYTDITSDPSREHNKWWHSEVAELLGDLMPPMEEYISIYGRLLVNSFSLRVDHNGEEESVGTALYRANSIFDHSCRPSASTVFTKGRLQIKAIVASPSLDLSQYFISYMDEAETRAQRQAKLKRTWYFDCLCPACSDPESEKEKHAAICDREDCRGQVCVNVATWEWSDCLACGQKLSKTTRFRYQETYEMVRQVVDENGGEVPYTDVNEFLVRQMVDKFYPTDLELMKAAMGAAQGNVHEKIWSKALIYLEQCLPGIRRYYHPLSGYLGPSLLNHGEALLFVGRTEEARAAVKEADTYMKVVPGQDSYIYTKNYAPRIQRIMAGIKI